MALHVGQRGVGLGHRHRVPAVRREGERANRLGHLGGHHRGAHRRAVRDPLGEGHHVGLDAPVLDAAPVRARAAPARLHLVDDEQAAGLADERLDAPEVVGRRDREASDPLDRLGHERGDLPVRAGGQEVGQVVDQEVEVGHVGHALGLAVEVGAAHLLDVTVVDAALTPVGVGGHRHHRGAAPRVGVAQRDHVAVAGVGACRHDGHLVGLGAAVREEADLEPAWGDARQELGDLDGDLVQVERARVPGGAHLQGGRLDHLVVRVTHRHGEDAAEEVEVTVPLDVPQPVALGVVHGQRAVAVVQHRALDGQQELALAREQLAGGVRVGDGVGGHADLQGTHDSAARRSWARSGSAIWVSDQDRGARRGDRGRRVAPTDRAVPRSHAGAGRRAPARAPDDRCRSLARGSLRCPRAGRVRARLPRPRPPRCGSATRPRARAWRRRGACRDRATGQARCGRA